MALPDAGLDVGGGVPSGPQALLAQVSDNQHGFGGQEAIVAYEFLIVFAQAHRADGRAILKGRADAAQHLLLALACLALRPLHLGYLGLGPLDAPLDDAHASYSQLK